MIHYTTMNNQDHGLLVFKVIGAKSREEAQQITQDNWGETLMAGNTLDGPPVICPLFGNLKLNDSENRIFYG